MSIQVQELGETVYSTSTFSIPAANVQTLMCWINANGGTWEGAGSPTGVRSMVGVYSSQNVVGGPTTGVASQIGTRGTNVTTGQIDVWDWGGGVIVSTTGYTPPLSTWIHVTFTYDGTNGAIYINGLLNNTTAYAKSTVYPLNMIFINGYIYGGTAETSEFEVDEVIFYNRTLTADEILSIYNTQGERDGDAYGCQARFSFDEQPVGNYLNFCVDDSQILSNIFPQSNTVVAEPGATGWTLGAGIVATALTVASPLSPDGSQTASELTISTLATSSAFWATTITTTATTAYYASCIFKAGTDTGTVTLWVGNTGRTIGAYVTFNLSTGAETANGVYGAVTANSYSITALPNGWYDVEIYGTFTAAGTAISVGFIGVTTTGNFYAWNPDINLTSLKATYGASITSPSDVRRPQI